MSSMIQHISSETGESNLESSLLKFTPLQLPQTSREGLNLAEKTLK